MKLAKTVTFGGSGLDRAAHLRGTEAGAPQSGDAAIVLWRGKVLARPSMAGRDERHPDEYSLTSSKMAASAPGSL